MKKIEPAILSLVLAASAPTLAQQPPQPPPCTGPESRLLDFWVGEWDLSYPQNGQTAKSRNRITKILDGCVIFEEFTGAPGTSLDGRSYSIFDAAARRWKQTWVDNQGSYLDFVGSQEGGDFIFAREAVVRGKKVSQRMVFKDITPTSLRWHWQKSEDGGATWTDAWVIDYKRIK